MAEAGSQTTLRCPPGAGTADVPTDAHLLRRFATDRDEAAFATLVERHGPLVLSVCRRVLGTVQDAEDAFQATFLVLARKAATIQDPGLLGNWLYGVASRIARKARAAVSKRQMHEKQVHLLPALQAPAAVEADDVSPVLDEELSRLPEKYRAALVLCYLQGKTNEEAARLLNWPTGTVKGRLARARDLLRSRLVRRGLRASAVLLSALLLAERGRAATVPDALAASTTRASVAFVGGRAGAVAPSARAVRLAEHVLGAARRARLVGLALVLLVFAVGTSVWLLGSDGWGSTAGSSGWGWGSPAPVESCHPSGGTR
ncbi:MAG TPA: sigma-70 family RNA polymerase sigma factor [Gemmataceae bacterium]|nr:sigma-70 family RNA polymerase sigma factor [Gemmataceae bacterium]